MIRNIEEFYSENEFKINEIIVIKEIYKGWPKEWFKHSTCWKIAECDGHRFICKRIPKWTTIGRKTINVCLGVTFAGPDFKGIHNLTLKEYEKKYGKFKGDICMYFDSMINAIAKI